MYKKMEFKDYNLSSLQSPIDLRDYKISKLTKLDTDLPEEFRIEYNGKIKDQGTTSCCVAYSLAYIKEIQEQNYEEFSIGYVYVKRDDDDYQGEGMIPREALNCLLKNGNVLNKCFNKVGTYYKLKAIFPFYNIGNSLDLLASDYRIKSYFKVSTETEIKNALIKYGALTMQIPIYENFYLLNNENAILSKPEENDYKFGYHQVTIVGWTKENNLICINSWGENWGDKGFFYVPIDFPNTEIWGICDDEYPKQLKIVSLIKKFISMILRKFN